MGARAASAEAAPVPSAMTEKTSNWKKEMEARADRAAEELLGTCKGLHEVCPNDEQDDGDFCARLDELVYECEQCGWWYEAGDGQHGMGSGFYCDDCKEEND